MVKTSLMQRVQSCVKCSELVQNRTQPVLGEGPVPCDIVFVGEAPGENEDARGIPFCGLTGTILETSARAVGLQRKVDYHILNTLKCRPPNNREPSSTELTNCRPFLQQQLRAIRPKVVVALGKYAQAFFLERPAHKVFVVRNMGKIVKTTLNDTAQGKALERLSFYVILSCHPRFTSISPDVARAFRIHIRRAKEISKGARPQCTALNAF